MPDGVKVTLNKNLMAELHQASVQAMTETFEQYIVPEAKRLVPVDTGALRDSISVVVTDDPAAHTVTAKMYTQGGYGFYVEHGTSHNRALTKKAQSRRNFWEKVVNDRTPARPFFWPAFKRNRQRIIAKWMELIGKTGEKAA